MPWHTSSYSTSKMRYSVEVDLFKFTRDFVAHVTVSSLFGSHFLQDYPQALSDLWEFDAAFTALALGVPAWAPIPLM